LINDFIASNLLEILCYNSILSTLTRGSTMNRNVLTIFLASPNDLSDERRIAREQVDRYCKVFSRRTKWQIELLGWEDTLPGAARPQSLINKEVNICDLFIGLLWKRWGTNTKEFDSGFHEEFSLAYERFKKTGKPDIWLFFKNVDEETLKDPGEQLKKVINFKQELIDKKELLFIEFDTQVSWETIFYDNLNKYMLDIYPEILNQGSTNAISHQKNNGTEISKNNISADYRDEYNIQVSEILKKITENISADKSIDIDPSERLRFYLFSSTLTSYVYRWKLFDNNDVNYSYQFRKKWEITNKELIFLTRSIFNDTLGFRPGWYWLRECSEEKITELLVLLATSDSDPNIKINAIHLLGYTNYRPTKEFLLQLITEEDKNLLTEIIILIASTKQEELLNILNVPISNSDPDISEKALSAQCEIVYNYDPNKAFADIIKSSIDIPPFLVKSINRFEQKIDGDLVIKVLKDSNVSKRRFAAEYLRKFKLMDSKIAYESLNDTDAYVRKEALLALVEMGEAITIDQVYSLFSETNKPITGNINQGLDIKRIIFPLLKKKKPEEILNDIDYFNIHSNKFYEFLAIEHYELVNERIHKDLDDDFKQMQTQGEAKLAIKYGEAFQPWAPDLVEFIKSTFISAALTGLAIHGSSEDIIYARKHLGKLEYNLGSKACLDIISRYGDDTDVDNLVNFASSIYTADLIAYSVEIAIKLSTNKDEFINRLISHNNNSIVTIAAKYISILTGENRISTAIKLLLSKESTIRKIGASILVQNLDDEKLEAILDNYITNNLYYFEVVVMLDRCLYAPGKYSKYYRDQAALLLQ
jgi:hypothetical protein